jgi:hypothetical protein
LFGVVAGVAAARGLELHELPHKRWQRAVLRRELGDRAAVDYDEVLRWLRRFLAAGVQVAERIAVLNPATREHARDAAAVSVLVALRSSEVMCVVGELLRSAKTCAQVRAVLSRCVRSSAREYVYLHATYTSNSAGMPTMWDAYG